MPSDPLPSPDCSAEPRDDAHKLVSGIARLEAVLRDNAALQVPAASSGPAESLNDSAEQPTNDATLIASNAERFDDTAESSTADSAEALSPGEDDVRSPEPVPRTLPEIQARGRADESNDAREPLPIPSPLEVTQENNRPSAAPSPEPDGDVSASSRTASHDSHAALRELSEEELIALFS